MNAPVGSTVGPTRLAHGYVRAAWVAVALLPAAFVLATLVGEGLLAGFGYPGGSEQLPPIGPALRAGVPALLIMIAPGVAAAVFGLRAYRGGANGGVLPAWIGGTSAVVAVALNLLGLLAGR